MDAGTAISIIFCWLGLLGVVLIAGLNIKYQRDDEYERLLEALKEVLAQNEGMVNAQQLVFKARVKPDRAINFLVKIANELHAEIVLEDISQGLTYTFKHHSTISKKN